MKNCLKTKRTVSQNPHSPSPKARGDGSRGGGVFGRVQGATGSTDNPSAQSYRKINYGKQIVELNLFLTVPPRLTRFFY